MAVYAIGDLHLSQDPAKKMDVFPGWEGYTEKIAEHWKRLIQPEDTVVLAGDTSWGMSAEGALGDFRMLEELPGRKLLVKGNHDYWWTTRTKMERFFEREGLRSLELLHNSAAEADGAVLCGSRGWMFERGEPHDRKLILREAARLDRSLSEGERFPGEKIVFLHYPPLYGEEATLELIDVMRAHQVRRCFYGHLHSESCARAVNGMVFGIRFQLISADYLGFCPFRIVVQNVNES